MTTNELTWTAKTGATITVTADGMGYTVAISGQRTYSIGVFTPVPAHIKAQAAAAGIVAMLGQIGVTAAQKATLEALRATAKAAVLAQPDARLELWSLEADLEIARERVLNMRANPAPAYAAEKAAQAALDAWKAAHPAEWTAEAAKRAADIAERKALNTYED